MRFFRQLTLAIIFTAASLGLWNVAQGRLSNPGVTSGGSGSFSDLTVTGNSTLGDSDAAGGDTSRVYGTLSLGATPTGAAQLFLKASSTISIPFLVQDSSGNQLAKIVSSSFSFLNGGANYAQQLTNGRSLLEVGSSSGNAGAISVRGISSAPALITTYRTADAISVQLGNGSLVLGSGSATTTLDTADFMFRWSASNPSGIFNINSSGNTSVSGTLRTFNTATFSGQTSSATSTISIGVTGDTKGGCLKIKDLTGSGFTYCTALSGTLTCSTISCE